MTFERCFKASTYCLTGAGFAAAAATGSIGPIPLLLFAAVFIISWRVDTVRFRKSIPTWVLNCLALAYFPFIGFDARYLSHSFLIAIIHLLFFISAVKLLTVAKDRDYLQLYLISFAEMLGASTLTVNIVFGICLLAFVFCGISTIVLFEMRRSNAKMQGAAIVRPLVTSGRLQGNGLELFSPFPARLFFATTTGITLLIIVAAFPLFFLLPRITLGLYRQPSGNTQFVSGFSDRVELGQIGTIKQSDAVVMRIKTNKASSEMSSDLKWRGIAFDYFDGRSWKCTDPRRFAISTQGYYYKLENSTQGTNWLNQTFFVEALSSNVIFAAHKVLAISQDVGSLRRDSSDSLYASQHMLRKLRYSAISDPARPDPANISDLLPIPPEIINTYLQLPHEDSRIADLAGEVTGKAANKYAKAKALEGYLRSNYSYSLLLRGTPNSKDPLAMFLFDVRSGHCEYFASSMAIMLRQLGIPSRLVNGFRIGEYNSIGDSWTVRQYHAHSWVEAYFPPYGWIEFDPTPSDPAHRQTEFARFVSNLADAIDLWWWDGIVNYDSSKQYRMLRALYSIFEKFRNGADNLLTHALEKSRTTMTVIRSPGRLSEFLKRRVFLAPLMAVVILLLIRPLRRRIFGRIRRIVYRDDSRIVAASFYAEALAVLGAQGFRLSKGQTPMEFARSLGSHPLGVSLMALTEMYNAIRFGPPGQHLDHAQAQAHLHHLRNSLRT
jgi:hypothetical protein